MKARATDIFFGVLGSLLVGIGGHISFSLRELTISVQDLNVKMAVVISQQANQESRLTRLEEKK